MGGRLWGEVMGGEVMGEVMGVQILKFVSDFLVQIFLIIMMFDVVQVSSLWLFSWILMHIFFIVISSPHSKI